MARFAVVVSDPDSATTRLHRLIGHRENLRAPFRSVWASTLESALPAEQEAWCEAVLDLLFVNAGPGCLQAHWTATERLAAARGLPALAEAAHQAREICRHAGAGPARLALAGLPTADGLLDGDTAGWWRTLGLLARRAPESLPLVLELVPRLLRTGGAGRFASFVAAGLKHGGDAAGRRRAFFALEDPSALRLIEAPDGGGFPEEERRLKLFARALWGRTPILRPIAYLPGQPPPRRSNLAGDLVRLPYTFPGVPAAQRPRLFRAAVAHATAHQAFGRGRFEVGKLKPLQLALIGLVEDARVELLALRRFPGLRRLWAPYHVAQPGNTSGTAVGLMARLARALFNPSYEDGDGFVEKGRLLFAAESSDLHDAALSRRVGGLLGNDLGQLRLQFNAKSYVVEPAYRDDGLGLWNQPADPHAAPPDEIEMIVDAARVERQEQEGGDASPDAEGVERRGKARPRDADPRGTALATYPEWDRAAQVERPDWTTVREVVPKLGDPRALSTALEREKALVGRINRLVRSARVGRAVRLRRQPDGHDIDLDALIDAAIALRTGALPDDRIHRRSRPGERDLAVTVLLDVSQSTADRIAPDGPAVLDVERLAVAVLAEAMGSLRETFSVLAFSSDGRDDVRLQRVKGFADPYGAAARARLVGLEAGGSTRLGAALRHAGAELAPVRAYRKLVVALTDGEPSDIDVADPLDLVEDARRAVLSLRGRGIDCFGVTLDPTGVGSGPLIFGRTNHMPARRIEDLPRRLSELYFRLARR